MVAIKQDCERVVVPGLQVGHHLLVGEASEFGETQPAGLGDGSSVRLHRQMLIDIAGLPSAPRARAFGWRGEKTSTILAGMYLTEFVFNCTPRWYTGHASEAILKMRGS